MKSILNSFILLGALQGFIVCALLRSSARRHPDGAQSKRLLAALIFFLALACLNLYVYELPWLQDTPIGNLLSAIIPLVIVMPVGPLIYFYIRSCLEPEFRMSRKYRPHFYSVVIDLFQHAAAVLFIIGLVTGLLVRGKNYHFGDFIDYYDQYADIPRWLSLVVYLWISARYLAKVKVTAAAGGRQQSAAGGQKQAATGAPLTEALAWPRTMLRVLIAFSLLWLVFLVPYELPRYSDALINRFDWYPLYLPIVLLIYWLGIKGYFISYRANPVPGAAPAPGKIPGSRPALPPEVAGPVVLALKKAMEEARLWLDPGLSLTLLAQHCGIAPKTLSAVLNQHLEKTFNEFVNEYRIDAVKERLRQPESRALTIAGLAYECGFNSLPTFQRAFKSITGLTPKEYISKNALPLEKADKL
jgi:AraC-like DNA-binding protein